MRWCVPPSIAPVAPQRPTVLGGGLATILTMGGDQLDAAPTQPLAQGVAVIALVGNHPRGLLSRTPAAVPPRSHIFSALMPKLAASVAARVSAAAASATYHLPPPLLSSAVGPEHA